MKQSQLYDQKALAFIQSAGRDGFAVAAAGIGLAPPDATGEIRRVDAACRRLEAIGLISRGKRSHRVVRFFATQTWARAWSDPATTVIGSSSHARAHAPWPAAAEAIYPTDVAGRPLYKFTRVLSPWEHEPLPPPSVIETELLLRVRRTDRRAKRLHSKELA